MQVLYSKNKRLFMFNATICISGQKNLFVSCLVPSDRIWLFIYRTRGSDGNLID